MNETQPCQVCLTSPIDGDQYDCGQVARIKVNGLPMCAEHFDEWEREGYVEGVEPLADEAARRARVDRAVRRFTAGSVTLHSQGAHAAEVVEIPLTVVDIERER